MNQPDLVHLTFTPPDRPGSYNRLVDVQMKRLNEFRQVAISYGHRGDGASASGDGVILVDGHGLSLGERLALRVPERFRKQWFGGIQSREYLTYAWQLARELARLRPPLIVCYDDYKLGPLLRRMIDWPCRLVLSQHGLSYYLPVPEAARLYSLRSFDAVCVLTRASYRADRLRMPAYEPLVSVIPNGVDVETFMPPTAEQRAALRRQWALPADKRVVLFLARLVPKKGAHLLLQAWAQILAAVPDAFLWIVGGGDASYTTYLNDLVRARPEIAASVRLEGRVPPERVSGCYQAADVYAFPTLFCEGMALSLLEAMASGLPAVVAEHDVARELFTDAEVVFVPDPNVEGAFVDPLVRLLEDARFRQQVAGRGRQAIHERYSQRIWLDRLRAFYRGQLGRSDDRRALIARPQVHAGV